SLKAGKAVARFYAARGRLFGFNPVAFGRLAKTNPNQEFFNSYDHAIKLDPQPEYYAQRGYARASLGMSLDKIEEDAKAALRQDAKFYGGHALTGWVLFARWAADPHNPDKLTFLKQADQALARAIDLARPDDVDLPTVLVARSAMLLQLALNEPA